MAMIKGITVILHEKVETGKDEFNCPIYESRRIEIDNVLVAPANISEILDTQNLTGKKAVYSIAIPKGDAHTWQDNNVEFFGELWHVIGFPQMGIEENIPLDWNQKWMVERYE